MDKTSNMRFHSDETERLLREQRKKGHSIDALAKKFSIARTTVWNNVHDVQLSSDQIRYLISRRGGSTERMQKNWRLARIRAKELLQSEYRDIAIAVAMLYWAEGSKKGCEFVNTDGDMIECYLYGLRKVFGVSEEYISPTLRLYTGMDQKNSLEYWASITMIPKDRFIIRFNDGGTHSRTKHGMCRIVVKKGDSTLKLLYAIVQQFSAEFVQKPKKLALSERAPVA